MRHPQQVIISIHGGLAEVVSKPADVEVVIHDYDVEGVDEEWLQRDANRNAYIGCVYRATANRCSP